MKNIKFLRLVDCKESDFVQPKSMFYIQNGVEKRWDIIDAHDSVSILLYHKDLDSFVFVKQFRPSIYLKNNDGFTYELCAGLVDKNTTLAQIAKEEIDEECGFDVPVESIEKITSFYTNVGVSGGCQHLYYAKINDSMKIHEGGGIHDEQIELMYLPIEEYKEFMYDETKAKTPGLMFAFMWFMENRI